MSEPLHFNLNGGGETVKNATPSMTLLEYLRRTGRVGTKEGCGDGDCGACTVALVGRDAEGKPQYQAVNSCLIPLGALAGRDIVTVEGVAGEYLHPVQQAMVDTGGSQCGYCTPGFIMSLFAGYYDGHIDDITIEGNLCRCTGYLPIRRAAASLETPEPNDPFVQSLPSAPLGGTFEHPEFYRPTTLAKLFEVWNEHPEATLIAGGTDLGLELSHKTRDFGTLLSLEAVEDLNFIADTADYLELGATTPLTHIEKRCRGIFPALDEMIHWFAARQIRNRATLGGNLGTASPIGDLPPVLLTLGAEIRLVSAEGERTVTLADFFTGYRQTVLEAQELILSVRIPKALNEGAVRRLSHSYKVGKRGTDDISIVAAAFVIDLDAADRIVAARLAYGGVASTPERATEVETWLVGKRWNPATVADAKTRLHDAFSPLDDLRGSAAYRKRLVANLFEKFFVQFSVEQVAA